MPKLIRTFNLNKFVYQSLNAPCPSCRGAPHTTAHIFSCPSHPTSLRCGTCGTVTAPWRSSSHPFLTPSHSLCPTCRGAPHTTAHIFCPSQPTSLTVRDLWDRPCAHRGGVPSFPLHTPSLPPGVVHPTPRLTSSPVPPIPLP